MLYGIIKKVNFDRGFGFIRQQRGSDVFFHATVVKDEAFEQIRPDQPVKYELAPRDKDAPKEGNPTAKIVELIEAVPGGILAPPPPAQAPKHHPRARQRKPTWRRNLGPDTAVGDAPAGDAPANDAEADDSVTQ